MLPQGQPATPVQGAAHTPLRPADAKTTAAVNGELPKLIGAWLLLTSTKVLARRLLQSEVMY
jgi:hypothetical protein